MGRIRMELDKEHDEYPQFCGFVFAVVRHYELGITSAEDALAEIRDAMDTVTARRKERWAEYKKMKAEIEKELKELEERSA